MVGWWVGRSVGWLVGWLVGRLLGGLGWLAGRLGVWLQADAISARLGRAFQARARPNYHSRRQTTHLYCAFPDVDNALQNLSDWRTSGSRFFLLLNIFAIAKRKCGGWGEGG
eukprot:5858301-Pyramimonas_sp.AAC.2